MKRSLAPLVLGLLALLGAAGFMTQRLGALRLARTGRESAQTQLESALKLAAKEPGRFGTLAPASTPDGSLKPLAQELAAARSVSLGYLSENERDSDGGRRERQLVLRLLNAEHPQLVRFLEDIEARGGGARIKELHLRPSRELANAYEEAEVVIARATEKKP